MIQVIHPKELIFGFVVALVIVVVTILYASWAADRTQEHGWKVWIPAGLVFIAGIAWSLS